jgi:hypothetical protein
MSKCGPFRQQGSPLKVLRRGNSRTVEEKREVFESNS